MIWRDITVGRILQQPGTPVGKPNWFWGVNLALASLSPPHTAAFAATSRNANDASR